MRAVVTVTGKDKKGIIAKVSGFLAEKGANIEDISQTILGEYFAMIMIVDVSSITMELSALAQECAELGKKIGMSIYLQHEDIFNAMHNV
jgi:ACT domain-containing protein